MGIVCGVDGCKDGWIVVSKNLDSDEVSWRLCETAREIVTQNPVPRVVAIDIPIGLLTKGSRECDLQARHLLGQPRGSSVFTAPIRPVLDTTSPGEASQIWMEVEGKGMTLQCFSIMRKIREVDDLLRQVPALRETFREVHPELCFYSMAGEQPVVPSKRDEEGRNIRRGLLEPAFGLWLTDALMDRKKLRCEKDDILDAFAALWTAERIALGTAQTIPSAPPQDRFGLRMEMVF